MKNIKIVDIDEKIYYINPLNVCDISFKNWDSPDVDIDIYYNADNHLHIIVKRSTARNIMTYLDANKEN